VIRTTTIALALAVLPGCLALNAPSAHMTGSADGGGIDDGSTGDAGLTPVSATDFCTRIAEVACSGYLSCCDTHMGDMPSCVTSLSMRCSSELGPVLTDARAGYDPNVAAQVIAEGQMLVGSCRVEIVNWYNSRTGLQRVFQGTFPGGAMCSMSASDLAAYFSCHDLMQGCIGSGSNFHCTARLQTGMPCFVGPDCVDGDYCMGGAPLIGIAGHCAQRENNGSTCMADGDCMSYLCNTTVTPHRCALLDRQSAYCGFH